MCGIAGYVQRAGGEDRATPILQQMLQRLRHRGPDGHGCWRTSAGGWDVALGHRRLSIIDLEGGRQPLGNEDGSVQVTFNGEIYNFQLLQRELERKGHRFATRCDTEVLVHLHEEQDVAGLSRLDGMFAFAIWDDARRRLVLARDRAGIKPLYYAALPGGGIAFASELTALLEHPAVNRTLDPDGIASYFFADYAHPPHAIVRGARKLEPGHSLVWSAAGGLEEPRPFWRLEIGGAADLDLTDLPHVLREALDDAVHSQMIADVPIGVFLSGGIDSSLVAALAQRHARGRLQTFSIAFEDPQYDESEYARQVAAHIGSAHVERTLRETDLLTTLDAALDALDEPMADPSILPTYLLSSLAAEHVKVVLGGDGGDELWAGYPTYKAHRYAAAYARLPRAVRAGVIAPLVAKLPVRHGYQSLEWKAKRFALRWDDDPLRRHMRWMSGTDVDDLRALLTTTEVPPQLANGHVGGCGNGDALNRVLAMDFAGYLPGSVLAKVDRASMAHGLEVRPPMLANDLIDFAFSLPASVKLRGGVTKAPLKAAAEGLLPPAVIHRRKKGFAIPLARWLTTALRPRVESVFADSPVWNAGLIDRTTFAAWWRQHADRRVDRSKPLWALLVLDHWLRRLG